MNREQACTGTETYVAVHLVGRRSADNVNLGLAYLAGALRDAGIAQRRHVLNAWTDLDPICDAVLAERPLVVGLSLADGGSAYLPLALGQLLRRRGYHGHITAGGQFATLARRWLLSRYGWLDSVVRLAGERPLVALTRALARGDAVDAIPAITTRRGDGPPADLDDELPLSTRPEHEDPLPELLGHRVAHLAASRGCLGACAYCGPAALQQLERQEARRAGLSRERCTVSGIAGERRRDIADVCREMAALWHERDVRYFYFTDEQLLPADKDEARRLLRDWKKGLARERVGPLGIGCMLRADRLDAELATKLVDVGLARAFIGLEFGSEEEARAYGRPSQLAQLPVLLSQLRDAHVATVSNLMLVHPESSVESIRAGLDVIAALPAGLVELNQMQVYHGTRLHRRLARQGRLTGNPLRYGTSFGDGAVARFATLFARLRAEAFHDYSLALRAHDASLAVALGVRLATARDARLLARELWPEVEAISAEVRALYVETLSAALDLVAEEAALAARADRAAVLISDAARACRGVLARLDALEKQAARHLPGDGRFSPMRSAAAAAMIFTFAGAVGLSGCDSRRVAAGDATSGRDTRALVDQRRADLASCTAAEQAAQRAGVLAAIEADVPCFRGSVTFGPDGAVRVASNPWYDTGSHLEVYGTCNDPQTQQLVEGEADRVASVVARTEHGCLVSVNDLIDGGRSADFERLAALVHDSCDLDAMGGTAYLNGVMIVLDAQGTVVEVRMRPNSAPTPEAIGCVRDVLYGLSFPCLAGFHVCPEFVIVE